ncbi:uncharacterized protein EV420DRAFT_798786 [Desarmillaria tabescens]|uniref:Uncharacterized protein n=1 Tax=Armillaria tabescens TaxID=1929756 RepID=A0AA39TPB0_ARMTA|nr:uncharacterized protein EV420DRAFT_798786 [Desarmillaria tabescens]KAK0465882.1 hypothetical protein EV420DRAFT_798786 [Desarmillaria tabescens]
MLCRPVMSLAAAYRARQRPTLEDKQLILVHSCPTTTNGVPLRQPANSHAIFALSINRQHSQVRFTWWMCLLCRCPPPFTPLFCSLFGNTNFSAFNHAETSAAVPLALSEPSSVVDVFTFEPRQKQGHRLSDIRCSWEAAVPIPGLVVVGRRPRAVVSSSSYTLSEYYNFHQNDESLREGGVHICSRHAVFSFRVTQEYGIDSESNIIVLVNNLDP